MGQLFCVRAVVCVYEHTQTCVFAWSCHAWFCPLFLLCSVVLFVLFGGEISAEFIVLTLFVVGWLVELVFVVLVCFCLFQPLSNFMHMCMF